MKKILLALPVAAFGVENLIFVHPLHAFMPSAMSESSALTVAFLMATLFFLAAVCIIDPFRSKFTASFPPALFFALFFCFHFLPLLQHPGNGSKWTVCFELIAIGSGTMAELMKSERFKRVARILFGISFIVFSVLHFVYADYIATLIPGWIPAHLFWAYFFGCAFLAAAISFLINRLVRIAGILLSAVFFTWVAVLHLPRCLHTPQTESEWTSLFVAFAIGASALVISGSENRSVRPIPTVRFMKRDHLSDLSV